MKQPNSEQCRLEAAWKAMAELAAESQLTYPEGWGVSPPSSQAQKPTTSSASNRLTKSEIEQLGQNKREALAYAQKKYFPGARLAPKVTGHTPTTAKAYKPTAKAATRW